MYVSVPSVKQDPSHVRRASCSTLWSCAVPPAQIKATKGNKLTPLKMCFLVVVSFTDVGCSVCIYIYLFFSEVKVTSGDVVYKPFKVFKHWLGDYIRWFISVSFPLMLDHIKERQNHIITFMLLVIFQHEHILGLKQLKFTSLFRHHPHLKMYQIWSGF